MLNGGRVVNEQIRGQLEIMNQQMKELSAIYHDAASKSGVSNNEFWVWYALLNMDGEYSQQDICDMWSLPKQTVNSIVANLLKKGLVFLEAVPGTRNRKIIRLTDAGRKYGEYVARPIYLAELRSLEKMSEQERMTCLTLISKYISLLKGELYEEFNE